MRGLGSQSVSSPAIRCHVVPSFWLRRRNVRFQRTVTRSRKTRGPDVCRYGTIGEGASYHLAQPVPLLFFYRFVHPSPQTLPGRLGSCARIRSRRVLRSSRNRPLRLRPQMWVKPKKFVTVAKVRLRHALSGSEPRVTTGSGVSFPHAASRRIPRQALAHLRQEPLGVGLMLEAGDNVVSVTHHDDVSRAHGVSATALPTGRRHSAGRCWPGVARSPHPCPVPLSLFVTASFFERLRRSHFWIRRMMRRSPTRCSTKRISHSWLDIGIDHIGVVLPPASAGAGSTASAPPGSLRLH